MRGTLMVTAILLAGGLAHAAEPGERSFYDFGPDPLADAVRSMEPKGLPARGALDDIADTSSDYAVERLNDRDVRLDADTILRVIPLSRSSGITLNIDDLSNLDDTSSRVSTDGRAFTLDPADVGTAMLLGVKASHGAVQDLLTTTRRWSSADRTIREVELTESDTLGGLALLARGIAIDPRDLLSVTAVAAGGSRTRELADLAPDPRLVQTASLPQETALAAAPIFKADGPVHLLDLANATLRTSDSGAFSRSVELPENVVLSAIALDVNGIRVDAGDLMTIDERRLVQRIHQTQVDLRPQTVLNALLLGAKAG